MRKAQIYIKKHYKIEKIMLSRGGVVHQLGHPTTHQKSYVQIALELAGYTFELSVKVGGWNRDLIIERQIIH